MKQFSQPQAFQAGCMCKGAKPEYDSTKLELEVADKKESLVRKNKRKEV